MKTIKIMTLILLAFITKQVNAQIITHTDLYKNIRTACLSEKPNDLSEQTADKFCECIAYETASKALTNKKLLPAKDLDDFYNKVARFDTIDEHYKITRICFQQVSIGKTHQNFAYVKDIIDTSQRPAPEKYSIKYERHERLLDSNDYREIYDSMSWIDQLHSNFEHSRAKSELKKYEQELANAQKNGNAYLAEIALAKIQRQQEIIENSHPIELEKIITLIILFLITLVSFSYGLVLILRN